MSVKTAQPLRAGLVTWPADTAARYAAQGYWSGRPFGELLHAVADAAPEAICLVDGDVRLSYRELMSRADGAALRLRDLGLRPEDRIVVQLPNRWEFAVLLLACFRLGVVPVTAVPAHREREMEAVADLAEARAIAVADEVRGFDHRAMARELVRTSDHLELLLVAGDAGAGDVGLGALCEPADDAALARAELDKAAPDAAMPALFLMSGGTTGPSKLIARTHNDYAYMATRAARICGFGPDDVYLAALPLGHGFPQSGPGLLGTLLAGARVVIAASPAPERVFPLVERERVTTVSLVPAAVQRWLEHRAVDRDTDLGSLRLLQVGAARLADELARRIAPELGCTLQQVYGMSEGLLCLTRPDDPEEVILGTQGRPVCPEDELLVVDELGEPVAPGEPGVLLTRGPYTPRGYYRAGELNRHAFTRDGWYRTGDVVRVRPDGNVVVVGRDKDVINRGGEKIAAEEVELLAYQVDGVSTAAAVAMPDPELGERVCLYVVPLPGRRVELAEVRTVMERAGLARFKLPERVVPVDSLPYTRVGKIDKKALRADIGRRLADEASGT